MQGKITSTGTFGFWFDADTQLALQLQQERIQVVRSDKVVRGLPTESNGSAEMDLGLEDICIPWFHHKRAKGDAPIFRDRGPRQPGGHESWFLVG